MSCLVVISLGLSLGGEFVSSKTVGADGVGDIGNWLAPLRSLVMYIAFMVTVPEYAPGAGYYGRTSRDR